VLALRIDKPIIHTSTNDNRASGKWAKGNKMKTKITVNANSSVTVERDDIYSGERTQRTYFVGAASGLGYVCYYTANGGTSQICEGMSGSGNTLRASRQTLPDVLRRELRKLNATEKQNG